MPRRVRSDHVRLVVAHQLRDAANVHDVPLPHGVHSDLLIDEAVYPDRQSRKDTLAKRITTKKLRTVSQAKLAATLGITQPRVSVLFKRNAIRRYIREAGKRDAVLLLLQKAAR